MRTYGSLDNITSLRTFFIILSLNFTISSSPLQPKATNANSVNFSLSGVLFLTLSGYSCCHCCIWFQGTYGSLGRSLPL